MKTYEPESSGLLLDYREAIFLAYDLGEKIKDMYMVSPPTVLLSHPGMGALSGRRISLNVH